MCNKSSFGYAGSINGDLPITTHEVENIEAPASDYNSLMLGK